MKTPSQVTDESGPTDKAAADRLVIFFVGASLAVVTLVIVIAELQGTTNPTWRIVQAIGINILSSGIGVSIAYVALRHYNEDHYKQLLVNALSQDIRGLNNGISATRELVLASANWKEAILKVNDIPYEKLFRDLRHLGLVVQGWDRWPEERSGELALLAGNGGSITVVLHNPDNVGLVDTMRSRWIDQEKNCVAEIKNTIVNFRNSVHAEHRDRIKVVHVDRVIWYCLIRFEYDRPEDTTYVVSPYAHKDFAVVNIPAIVIKKANFPELAKFFDKEWDFLAAPAYSPNGTATPSR